MASESVSFDFTSRGADSLARDFKSTGDSAVLAANGARLLADSLEKERKAAQASAAATLAAARADKILADAEDDAIAKSVEERIALEKAAEAKKKDAEAARLDAERTKEASKQHEALIGRLQNAGKVLGAGGILAGGAGALSLAGPLGGLGAAIGAFGAIAGPELTKISEAMQKTGKARKTAFASFTPDEKKLAGQLTILKDSFHGVEASLAPLISDVVQTARVFLTDMLPAFKILADVGGRSLEVILAILGRFLKSPAFGLLAKQLAHLASEVAPLLGTELVALLKVFLELFVQVGPAGIKMLEALLPAIVDITVALTPLIVLLANVVAATLLWLQNNHLLIPALALVGAAIIATVIAVEGASAPIWLLVAAVAAVAAGAFYLAKHWREVWASVKSIAADAWSWISSGWHKYLFLGLYAIVSTVLYVVRHWSGAWHDIRTAVSDAWTFMRIQFDRMELLFLEWAKTLVHAAATAFGWIPGLGGKLKAADRALASFIASTEARLRGLTQKHYAITFGLNLPAGVSAGPSFSNRRKYGFAAGTAGAPPGWAWVGERGPELVHMRGGETVIPNHALGGVPGFAAGTGVVSVELSLPTLQAMSAVFGAAVSRIVQAVRSSATFAGGPGAPGPARHAAIPYLEGLWDAAGGPPGLAHLMAAIAMAESGGNPAAYNPSGATGLWQILGAVDPRDQPFLFNPAVNAHEAVLKWRTQGLGAWVTYTSGAYRAFYDNGGVLNPGLTLAYNGTGRPEQVIPPGGRGGAGNTYHITVSVPPNANLRDIGRVTVEAIKMYEKGSGSGWRR